MSRRTEDVKSEIRALHRMTWPQVRAMRETVEVLLPVAFVLATDRTVEIIGMVLQETLPELTSALGLRLRQGGACGLVAYGDAWVSSRSPAENQLIVEGKLPRPRDDPAHRTEAVTAILCTRASGWVEQWMYPYSREAGTIVWGEPRCGEGGTSVRTSLFVPFWKVDWPPRDH